MRLSRIQLNSCGTCHTWVPCSCVVIWNNNSRLYHVTNHGNSSDHLFWGWLPFRFARINSLVSLTMKTQSCDRASVTSGPPIRVSPLLPARRDEETATVAIVAAQRVSQTLCIFACRKHREPNEMEVSKIASTRSFVCVWRRQAVPAPASAAHGCVTICISKISSTMTTWIKIKLVGIEDGVFRGSGVSTVPFQLGEGDPACLASLSALHDVSCQFSGIKQGDGLP